MDKDLQVDHLYHGDCITLMKNVNCKSIDLTLTDIPYNECNQKSGGLRQLDRKSADSLDFDLQYFLNEVTRITKGSIYIFCGIQQVSFIYSFFRELNLITRHCVWQKSNPSPMNGKYTWLSAFENCIFAKFSKATFNENCKSNVWKWKTGDSKFHPTEKPLGLFAKLIQASSSKRDVVFDPCVGSGTTAVAAIQTYRHFIGIENNDKWHALAQRRVNAAIRDDMFCLQRRANNG